MKFALPTYLFALSLVSSTAFAGSAPCDIKAATAVALKAVEEVELSGGGQDGTTLEGIEGAMMYKMPHERVYTFVYSANFRGQNVKVYGVQVVSKKCKALDHGTGLSMNLVTSDR